MAGFLPKKNDDSTWPHSMVPFCTASNTCGGGTISPAAVDWIVKRPSVTSPTRLAKSSAEPYIVSRLFGHMVDMRQRMPCACPKAFVLVTPTAAAAPALVKKSRLFIVPSG
jgi:hypothetical protein